MIVRTLNDNEPMPQHLGTGFEAMPIDRQWVWVAENDGKIVGILLAGACHGMVYLMRVCAEKGCSQMVVRALIEKTRADCAARGFKGYFFHLDPTTDQRLLRTCRKYGGVQLTNPQVVMVGSLGTRRACRHS
jgi:hypothetical protein